MYDVVCAFFSCSLEDCAVYCVCGFECGASLFANEFSKAVWRSVSLVVVVVVSWLWLWVMGHVRKPPMGGEGQPP